MEKLQLSSYLSDLDHKLNTCETLEQWFQGGMKVAAVWLKEFQHHPFLLGELSFYHRRYSLALQHYLKWKEYSEHSFFCYRATAYLFDEQGREKEANQFALRALHLHPYDPFLKSLTQKEPISLPPAGAPMLGSRELDELAHIFQTSSDKKALFDL